MTAQSLTRPVPVTETNLRVSASSFNQRLEFLYVAALVAIAAPIFVEPQSILGEVVHGNTLDPDVVEHSGFAVQFDGRIAAYVSLHREYTYDRE